MSNSLCLILEHQCYIYVLNLKQLINIYSLYIIYIYICTAGDSLAVSAETLGDHVK